jgi:putative PEP-CTERM system histidine kinase
MNFSFWLAYIAAGFTAGVAAVGLSRDPRSFIHRAFALGMFALAVNACLIGIAYQASSIEKFLFWQQLQIIISSFVPGLWVLFSVSFARTNYSEQISKWKSVLLSAFVLPVLMATVFKDAFFEGLPVFIQSSALFIQLGWSGYLWHVFWIIFAVMILMNLERTFRHATGHMRWQTKFMFLGIGSIFIVHLFTGSQAVLFKGINTGMNLINLGVLLIADIFILRSLFRGKPLNISIHFSHQFLYNSITALIVGLYFIAVGGIAWFNVYFEWIKDFHLLIFLIFAAVLGIAVVLLSDRLRMRRKRFISRHFKLPQYDYQKIWEDFTKRTATITNIPRLCNVIVKMVSETLEILSVSIWLIDERYEELSFGGSTVFTAEQAENLLFYGKGGTNLIGAMLNQAMPVDLKGREDDWAEDLRRIYGLDEAKESQIRYCIPLNASGRLVGIMTLSEKVFYEPLTYEETELIKTISDQAAAALMNLRLSERLRQSQELEAFQSMSAFFMHDLKNLASKLSLVTQNLPVHIDNPEFRTDALKTISQSVTKINAMCSRLSLLSQKLELNLTKTDLKDLVKSTVSDTKDYVLAPITQNLDTVPSLLLDREQIHKVLENLLMNAYDALRENGQIEVTTCSHDKWAEISVRDNGCGMSKEFMEKSLFRPFQTTKKQGMGIGLYHCKTIIEAHGGKIEVDSEEEKGTTFKVLLPMDDK